jgi:hypothetical protein
MFDNDLRVMTQIILSLEDSPEKLELIQVKYSVKIPN